MANRRSVAVPSPKRRVKWPPATRSSSSARRTADSAPGGNRVSARRNLFHLSNLRLSDRADGLLSRLIVTPRLHGIHHARDPRLRESNWSNGLALWDVLHGTRLTGVPP